MSNQYRTQSQNSYSAPKLHPGEDKLHQLLQANAQAQAQDQLSQRKRCFLDQEESSSCNGSSSDVSPGRKRMVGNDRSVHLLDTLPAGWSPAGSFEGTSAPWCGAQELRPELSAASSSDEGREHNPLSVRHSLDHGRVDSAGRDQDRALSKAAATAAARRRGEFVDAAGCDEDGDSRLDFDRKRTCHGDSAEKGEWGEWVEDQGGELEADHPSARSLEERSRELFSSARRSRTMPAQFLPTLPVSPDEERGESTEMSLLMALALGVTGSATGPQWEALPPRTQRMRSRCTVGAGAGVDRAALNSRRALRADRADSDVSMGED
jgi:hypothetical protein